MLYIGFKNDRFFLKQNKFEFTKYVPTVSTQFPYGRCVNGFLFELQINDQFLK